MTFSLFKVGLGTTFDDFFRGELEWCISKDIYQIKVILILYVFTLS